MKCPRSRPIPEVSSIGLRRQFSWILVGRLAGAVIQALSLMLVARWSGPQAFGLFSSIYGIAIVIQTVVDFGLTTHITRLRAADPGSGDIGAALRLGRNITILTTVVGTGFLVAAGFVAPSLFPLVLLPLWMSSEKQVEAWLAVALADGNTWQNASSLVFRRIGALVVLVAGYFLGLDPVMTYVFGLALFSLLAWALAYYMTDGVHSGATVPVRRLLKAGRPYWVNSLSVQARNFDVSIVALVTTPVAAGYYAAASRLTTPLRMVPTSFAAVLLPATTRSTRGNARPFIKAIAAMTALTTVMYVGLAVALPILVPVILGPSYEPASTVIQIVCFGLIAAAITSQFNALMQGWGYLRPVAVIATCTTVYCLVAIVVLAIPYGAVGAGIALASSYVIQLVLQIATMIILSKRAV